MAVYLYRLGDGNEGNYPRALVTIGENDCPYSALRALVLSEYRHGRVRRYIGRNLEVDGEAGFGISAVVYEGPEGERAFESAWITADLDTVAQGDVEFLEARHGRARPFRHLLDDAAKRDYQREVRKARARPTFQAPRAPLA